MIYGLPGIQEPIDQGDIIDGCPTLNVTGYDVAGLHPPQIDVAMSRVLVLTQTCDLANQKAMSITLAVLLDAQALVDPGVLRITTVAQALVVPAVGATGRNEKDAQ